MARRDFAYVFVGHFVGGGIVLDAAVHGGRHGNAAAFGSLPVPDPDRPGRTLQLIDAASLHVLENTARHQRARGHDGREGRLDPALEVPPLVTARGPRRALGSGVPPMPWRSPPPRSRAWSRSRRSSSTAPFPAAVRASLCERTRLALGEMDTRGVRAPLIVPGSIGPGARTLGAARLPLFARFLLDQGVLTRLAAD